MKPTTTANPLAAIAFLFATLFALAPPAVAADPAAKALKKSGRAVEQTVRKEGATQVKALRDSLNSLLKDVAAQATTPTDALGEAVLAATEAAGAVSTAAFDGVTMVRQEAVDLALGGAEGVVLLGVDFQSGGGGIWDDFIDRMHGHMSKVDERVAKELWKFVGKLEKTVGKLGDAIDVHLQVREHDTRIDAVQCPASLAANPAVEALADLPVKQVYIEARIVMATDDFSSQLGIFGFGSGTVDLDYETSAGTTSVTGVPMLPSGVALNTMTLGDPALGPYRVDVLDPATGERSDSVGGRPPSNSSASGVDVIVKQARQAMNQDFKFYGQVTGQIRGDYRKADKIVCEDFANGSLSAEAALEQLFGNHRNALGNTNFWERIVTGNPLSSAQSQLTSSKIADEDIPDDLAADAGGALSRHTDKVQRRTGQRLSSFQRIADRSVSRILKKLAKDGQGAAVATRSPRLQDFQGPTISTLLDPVIQLEITPTITSTNIITLEISPDVFESTAYLTGRTPALDPSLVLTHVNLANGDTVVLGGLMSSPSDNTFQAKVPLLGDIPLVGRLFRARSMDQADTDLVVVITPHLIMDT